MKFIPSSVCKSNKVSSWLDFESVSANHLYGNFRQMVLVFFLAPKTGTGLSCTICHLNNENSTVKKHVYSYQSKDHKGIEVKIIMIENDPANLRLYEAFYIKKCKPIMPSPPISISQRLFWCRNSNSRDTVANSPSFFHPVARVRGGGAGYPIAGSLTSSLNGRNETDSMYTCKKETISVYSHITL